MRFLVLSIYLALGPVFWIPSFGHILYPKFIYLTGLLIIYTNAFTRLKLKYYFYVLLVFILYYCALYSYKDDLHSRFVNIYLNIYAAFILFVIGMDTTLNGQDNIHVERKLIRTIRISTVICASYCLILLVMFVIGIEMYYPESLTLSLENGELQLQTVYESGWGFGRTQWSTCLSTFVPASFFFLFRETSTKTMKNIGMCILLVLIVLGTQLISGGRGGCISSILAIVLIMIKLQKNKLAVTIYIVILIVLIFALVSFFSDFFRLNDLSSGRDQHWMALPSIINNVPFWGRGEYGEKQCMPELDYRWAFHDSFIKYYIGFGFAGIISGMFILRIIYIAIKNYIHFDDPYQILFSCIILVGFFTSFFEPNPIFVAFYWPLWWLTAGYIFKQKDVSQLCLHPIAS